MALPMPITGDGSEPKSSEISYLLSLLEEEVEVNNSVSLALRADLSAVLQTPPSEPGQEMESDIEANSPMSTVLRSLVLKLHSTNLYLRVLQGDLRV